MLLESPRVKDSKVLSNVGELNTYKKNLIEVIEKLVVLVPGIQQE